MAGWCGALSSGEACPWPLPCTCVWAEQAGHGAQGTIVRCLTLSSDQGGSSSCGSVVTLDGERATNVRQPSIVSTRLALQSHSLYSYVGILESLLSAVPRCQVSNGIIRVSNATLTYTQSRHMHDGKLHVARPPGLHGDISIGRYLPHSIGPILKCYKLPPMSSPGRQWLPRTVIRMHCAAARPWPSDKSPSVDVYMLLTHSSDVPRAMCPTLGIAKGPVTWKIPFSCSSSLLERLAMPR